MMYFGKSDLGKYKIINHRKLGHSYGMHLLENGKDLKYIQETLGNKNSKTIEIYNHFSIRSRGKIKSSFYSLDLNTWDEKQ